MTVGELKYFIRLFYFLCSAVLSALCFVPYVYLVPEEVKRDHWIHCNWNNGWL